MWSWKKQYNASAMMQGTHCAIRYRCSASKVVKGAGSHCARTSSPVSNCTFVPVKQVNCGSAGSHCARTSSPVSNCTFVPLKQVNCGKNVSGRRGQPVRAQLISRQSLYFCTSKASTMSSKLELCLAFAESVIEAFAGKFALFSFLAATAAVVCLQR